MKRVNFQKSNKNSDKNNKAIFLDRDGTLNYDGGYLHRIEDVKILDGTKEGLKILKKLGYKLIMISNQSGIGRGYYTIEDCNKFNEELENQLGIKFDAVYICPHSPDDNCECRKPKTLLVEKAVEKFNLNILECYFIGDKESDIQMGINAGCKTVLMKGSQYECKLIPNYTVRTIQEFSELIS